MGRLCAVRWRPAGGGGSVSSGRRPSTWPISGPSLCCTSAAANYTSLGQPSINTGVTTQHAAKAQSQTQARGSATLLERRHGQLQRREQPPVASCVASPQLLPGRAPREGVVGAEAAVDVDAEESPEADGPPCRVCSVCFDGYLRGKKARSLHACAL